MAPRFQEDKQTWEASVHQPVVVDGASTEESFEDDEFAEDDVRLFDLY